MVHFSKLLTIAACFAGFNLLFSCTKNTIEDSEAEASIKKFTTEELNVLDTYFNGTSLSEEEVIDNAELVMKYLDSKSSTKGESGRFISNITGIKGKDKETKGTTDSSSIAYIVNFGDSKGFTILSADRRTDEIFTIVPEGNLKIESLEQDYKNGKIPESVLWLMSNIDFEIQKQIEEYENEADKLMNSAFEKISSSTSTKAQQKKCTVLTSKSFLNDDKPITHTQYYSTTRDWTNEYSGSVSPMVKVAWNQESPYNILTPKDHGTSTYAGCVAIAMAQLMTYWRRPSIYNWDLLTRNTVITDDSAIEIKNEVSRLVFDVGVAVGMDYGTEGSSANTEDAIDYFRKVGYTNPGVYDKYDENRLLNSLYAGCPVLIRGTDIKTILNLWLIEIELKGSGHCWVIDGALRQSKEMTLYYDDVPISTETKYRTLFNCNFGWGIKYNGYYASEAFDTNNGLITKCIETVGEKYNYQYNLNVVYNIKAY